MDVNEIEALIRLMESKENVNQKIALQLIKPMAKNDWNLFIRYVIKNKLRYYGTLCHGSRTYYNFTIEKVVLTIDMTKFGHAYIITTKIMNCPFANQLVINNDLVHFDDMEDIMTNPLNMYEFSKPSLNLILDYE